MPWLLKTQKIEINIMLLIVTMTFVGCDKSDKVQGKCTQNKKKILQKLYLTTNLQNIDIVARMRGDYYKTGYNRPNYIVLK
jgi:hypothetical protein